MDLHRRPRRVGTPATVVHASALSMSAILAGIRAGHVFIDTQGTRDRFLDLTASAGKQNAEMGDALTAPQGEALHFIVQATAPAGARVELIVDGKIWQPKADLTVHGTLKQTFDWPSDGRRHWIGANVRGTGGELLLVGNPIYINACPGRGSAALAVSAKRGESAHNPNPSLTARSGGWIVGKRLAFHGKGFGP